MSEPLPGRARQRAMAHEGLHADDRVVAPVVRFGELPVVQAGGEQRPVYPRGELLHTGIEGVAPGRTRAGLDDAGIGVGFHQAHQPPQAVAGHHAVGIETDHVAIVLFAPAAAEVGDVAALLLMRCWRQR